MRSLKIVLLLASSLSLLPVESSGIACARESGPSPGVIAFGEAREQIRNTPIEKRPNRPLHFYGNAVRRRGGRR